MQTPSAAQPGKLVSVRNVMHLYHKSSANDIVVLDNVNLEVDDHQIVALLGRSGSGKSTLLRVISGLMAPSSGDVEVVGEHVNGPARDVAMVFQSFALFPWLTVLQNVELGLEAKGVPAAERRKRALAAIDMIGLDGFESAYPREISGGMRQRVGLARALVVQPKVLLMDEPFSALDVLTAETLRTDLLDMWSEGRMPTQAILMVTHNIEEAVLMCDRILVFSSNPGRVIAEVKVDLPRPRNRQDTAFRAMVDSIYTRMTKGLATSDAAPRDGAFPGTGIGMILPRVSTNTLAGLLEAVAGAPFNGRADLPLLAEQTQMEADELFVAGETLQLLRFADLADGDMRLSPDGQRFAGLGVDERKTLFKEHLIKYVPLVAHIKRVLDERPSHKSQLLRFQDELEDHMSEEASEATVRNVINWSRYAEVFSYDESSGTLSLENPT
jgi:NitT/TauT family transport system ATP-binding protein